MTGKESDTRRCSLLALLSSPLLFVLPMHLLMSLRKANRATEEHNRSIATDRAIRERYKRHLTCMCPFIRHACPPVIRTQTCSFVFEALQRSRNIDDLQLQYYMPICHAPNTLASMREESVIWGLDGSQCCAILLSRIQPKQVGHLTMVRPGGLHHAISRVESSAANNLAQESSTFTCM